MTCQGVLAAGASQAYVDKVGEFGASGFIFKDTVDVISYEDPAVRFLKPVYAR
jgi:hypothetical protein